MQGKIVYTNERRRKEKRIVLVNTFISQILSVPETHINLEKKINTE